MKSESPPSSLEELRRRKRLFDNTWMLTVGVAAIAAVASWYLGLVLTDIAPVIGTVGCLALLQFALNGPAQAAPSCARLRLHTLASQLVGIAAMGVAWHLLGGLQQPTFPLLILLPLFAGGMLLTFWQRQAAVGTLLLLLSSGVFLSPDTNSFIEERYGLRLVSESVLPAWLPRSRITFADVATSPAYDLMLTGMTSLLAISLSSISRAIITLFERSMERTQSLQDDLNRALRLNLELVASAPSPEVLVMSSTGRIMQASDRFMRAFRLTAPVDGSFLLDTVAFAYPAVIRRLLMAGGEEIQAATIDGREVALRVRAGIVDGGASQIVRLSLDPCEEVAWRRALDSLDEPVFAIDSRGELAFLNRPAAELFGTESTGRRAQELFDGSAKMARWWDIAPLQSARRMVDRGERRYLAFIRRERIAESIGEVSFVQLRERTHSHAIAVS